MRNGLGWAGLRELGRAVITPSRALGIWWGLGTGSAAVGRSRGSTKGGGLSGARLELFGGSGWGTLLTDWTSVPQVRGPRFWGGPQGLWGHQG